MISAASLYIFLKNATRRNRARKSDNERAVKEAKFLVLTTDITSQCFSIAISRESLELLNQDSAFGE